MPGYIGLARGLRLGLAGRGGAGRTAILTVSVDGSCIVITAARSAEPIVTAPGTSCFTVTGITITSIGAALMWGPDLLQWGDAIAVWS